MKARGSCQCGNIEITWDVDEIPTTPRACQCDYCLAQGASYVSKPNSAISAIIHNTEFHRIVQHGTNTANFHECCACNRLVFVSSQIDGCIYGVINSQCLHDVIFDSPIDRHFVMETEQERLQRRQQNWCSPVVIHS